MSTLLMTSHACLYKHRTLVYFAIALEPLQFLEEDGQKV